MKKMFFSVIASILMIYFLVGLLLYLFQNSLIYYPTPLVKHAFTEKIFMNDDETIRVITLNEGKKNAIVYFGGNAESVAHSAEVFFDKFPEYTVYLVNYRGYGGSSGTPTQAGLFNDAIYIYDNIKKDHQHIIAIGRSLGSAVAVYLASQREIEKLVLITPFDTLQSVAQEQYPIFPMSFFLKDKYRSVEYVEKNSAKKTLMLIAQDDKIIPASHAYTLAKYFVQNDLTIKVIEGKGHNTISSDKSYYTLLKEFID
ncbi:alpha/beta hydrolase [Sulfurovum sp. zt1-1]|uniref:Alpha/beta hydrolase n=1 Tax=Sulfurovum zhangzhouensis TaxID=3019067 RepID=A0ABT7R0S3_9BACT|nr:alpha/beta hydrolase [Sulfurovum zhangzhouensis]MDM5272685.1 alpha/beta hydrolase [Sulfurovum zhangzhouensis]